MNTFALFFISDGINIKDVLINEKKSDFILNRDNCLRTRLLVCNQGTLTYVNV